MITLENRRFARSVVSLETPQVSRASPSPLFDQSMSRKIWPQISSQHPAFAFAHIFELAAEEGVASRVTERRDDDGMLHGEHCDRV